MKSFFSFITASLLVSSTAMANDNILIQLTPNEEEKLVAIGEEAAKLVSQRLMRTISADIKAVGLAEAARGWSKSVGIINETADSFNLDMKIRRPTFQYRNPINKPDAIDEVALNFFQASESANAKYFARKLIDEENVRYIFYKPMYVSKKCLLCHSQDMAEDVKAVIKEKYPDDRSGDLSLGDFRAAIRVDLPESAIK